MFHAVPPVSHRIGILIDLFMGAVYADAACQHSEAEYVRALVADLLCTPTLPSDIGRLIDEFSPERFDLQASVTEFMREPPMNKRRLLELVAYVTLSDGRQNAAEDEYLRDLAQALEIAPEAYRHMTSDPDMAAMRESFTDLARIPLPL